MGYRARSGRYHSAVAVATILVATAITTLALSASPAEAEELAPSAKLAVALAVRLPADEAKRQIKICEDYRLLFESEYDSYIQATNDKDRAEHAKNANHAFDNAHDAGCGWTGA